MPRFLRIGKLGWLTVILLLLGFVSLIFKWPLAVVVVIHVAAYSCLGLYIRSQYNIHIHINRRS